MFEARIERKGGGASLAVVLDDLGREIADFRGWAGALATEFYSTEREAFDTEGASIGAPWAPLSPKYQAWKERRYPGRSILELEGDGLAASLTGPPPGERAPFLESAGGGTAESVLKLGADSLTVGSTIAYAGKHLDRPGRAGSSVHGGWTRASAGADGCSGASARRDPRRSGQAMKRTVGAGEVLAMMTLPPCPVCEGDRKVADYLVLVEHPDTCEPCREDMARVLAGGCDHEFEQRGEVEACSKCGEVLE